MATEGSGATRAGGEDFHNEDAFLVEEGLGLYVVCDGVAGRPGGEVASEIAVHALEEYVARAEEKLGKGVLLRVGAQVVVEKGLHHALSAVVEASKSKPELEGMATTVTMLLAQGNRGVIGHLGDSRAYLIRRGNVHLMTHDHELTGSLSDEVPKGDAIETFSIELEARDTLVLCTDGAEEVVEDATIARVASDLSPALLASRIVNRAHLANPDVDATAVVVRVRGEREAGWLSLSAEPKLVNFGHVSYA